MPQASEELRAAMAARFGSPTDDTGPLSYLRDNGYTLNRDWTWSKRGISDVGQMTRPEFECLLFLVHEWGFGGISGPGDLS